MFHLPGNVLVQHEWQRFERHHTHVLTVTEMSQEGEPEHFHAEVFANCLSSRLSFLVALQYPTPPPQKGKAFQLCSKKQASHTVCVSSEDASRNHPSGSQTFQSLLNQHPHPARHPSSQLKHSASPATHRCRSTSPTPAPARAHVSAACAWPF